MFVTDSLQDDSQTLYLAHLHAFAEISSALAVIFTGEATYSREDGCRVAEGWFVRTRIVRG